MKKIISFLNKKHLKAGGWYTISDFINKGLAFLMMPVLTRLMSTVEYGEFSNFSAWAAMIVIVSSLDMSNVIVRAKFDYENTFEQYISNTIITTFISTGLTCSLMYLFRLDSVRFV